MKVVGYFLYFAVALFFSPTTHAYYHARSEAIEHVSGWFLGKPYVKSPLGEGAQGKYDRDPLFRFDAFDCTTYVETVMALVIAKDQDEFQKVLTRIRYKDGIVGFVSRNHFPDLDWIANNTRERFIFDITRQIAGAEPVPMARAVVDKKTWYEKMAPETLQVPEASAEEKIRLLFDLHREGAIFRTEISELPYLAWDSLLKSEVQARIPSGTIFNVVRPNWDLRSTLGTAMNVSHQGWIIRKQDQLYVRHAANVKVGVVEVTFSDFISEYLKSTTAKGLSFLSVTY